MTPALKPTLVGLYSGIALALAIAPAKAQVSVTGGEATINDAEIFVPDTGALNNNDGTSTGVTDTRSVITEGSLQEGSLLIQTNQGDIPTNAIFRFSTLPVIESAGNGATPTGGDGYADIVTNFAGSEGEILGTLSFRSVSPGGPQFVNIPTTLNFQVQTPGMSLIDMGAGTEFRTEPLVLQETGFVVDAPSAGGVVQRRTPVVLVQYQDGEAPPTGSATPEETTVLGNDISEDAYTRNRDGQRYSLETLDVGFTGGQIETPPGFTLEGAAPEIEPGILVSRFSDENSVVEGVSIFLNTEIVEIPYPPSDDDDDDFDDGDDDDDFDDGDDGDDGDDVTNGGTIGDNGGIVDGGSGIDNGGSQDGGDDDGGGGDDGGGDDDDDFDDSDNDDDFDDGDDGDDVTNGGTIGDNGGIVDGGSGIDNGGSQDGDDDDNGDDDDDGDDDEAEYDDGTGNPNDGSTQVRPIYPRFFFVGLFVFQNVPSGRWFDPPMADGFQYEMAPRDVPVGVASRVFPGLTGVGQAEDALFTSISGFPTGVDADDRFVVSVEGEVLGEFGPNDTVNFSDYAEQLGDRLVDGEGVTKFTITEIDPAVDSSDPTAFPLKLDFNTPTASFEMRALQAENNQNASAAQ